MTHAAPRLQKRYTFCAQRQFEEKERWVWPHAEQLYISIWPSINHSLMQMTLVWIMMMRSLIHHAIVVVSQSVSQSAEVHALKH